MNNPETNYFMNEIERLERRVMELERLAGVQGPERHLVEDVAERIPQRGDVEAPQEGRRGVEEIGGAIDTLESIDRQLVKARVRRDNAAVLGWRLSGQLAAMNIAALEKHREEVAATVSQRSDLLNS